MMTEWNNLFILSFSNLFENLTNQIAISVSPGSVAAQSSKLTGLPVTGHQIHRKLKAALHFWTL